MMNNKMQKNNVTILTIAIVVGCFWGFSVEADVVGQNVRFSVDKDYDAQSKTNINATARNVSSHAYGYIEDGFWNGLSEASKTLVLSHVDKIMNEFDNRIYPIETNFFGSEPNPGIDNDLKITILFTPLISKAGGYFNTSDCYPRDSENPNGNNREMFYLNTEMLSNETKIEAYLTHELQHLITFNQKELLRHVSDDTWLNEVRSEFAVTLLGYNDQYSDSNLASRIQSFLSYSSDSLTEWKNQIYDYAQISLFGEFLSEHWTMNLLADSLKSSLIGIPSLSAALTREGFSEKFIDIFRDWMIANIVNDSTVNAKYGYLKPEVKTIHVQPSKVINNLGDSITTAVADQMVDWQQHWYDISTFAPGQNSILKLDFSSMSLTSFQVSYLVFKPNGGFETKIYEPTDSNHTLYLSGIGTDFSRIIVMPFKKDKVSGFTSSETLVNFAFTIERIKNLPVVTPTPIPSPSSIPTVKPADFGLHEGDFIRAEGDIDVYIINDFGYKRLILNPAICLMYGHLGARGCFSALKVVAPSVRDAFTTSWLMKNGETNDGKVHKLETTGDDTASLHWLNISGADFLSQDGDFNSVFLINSNEQKSYTAGSPLLKL
jgi:hypothetical protein